MRPRPAVVRAATLLTVAAAVTACGGLVDGRGTRAMTTAPASTATSAPTSALTGAPSATVPFPSASPGRSLTCTGAGTISVAGAPFCYPLPSGFSDFSDLSGYGRGWTYRTLVSAGRNDLVEVFASRYTDTSRLSDVELLDRFDSVGRLRVGRYDIVNVGPVARVQVDGARGFRQTGRYRSGVATDTTTIFLGRTVASIQCQSLRRVAEVRDACVTVRSTLQLVSL